MTEPESALLAALEQIAEITEKRQLPLTSEINDIAVEAIAKVTGESSELTESEYMKALRTGVKPDVWPPIVMSRDELEHFRSQHGIS